MDWSASTWWWVACGVLVAAEMTTGTFYLLMLALGVAAAALAAHGGLGFSGQLLVAAAVGGGAVAAWHFKRGARPAAAPARSNRDVNLDIGEQVRVEAWDAEGQAQVSYRGAQWAARWHDDTPPAPGLCTIRAVDGNRLLLGR
jgi:membrane protein implicated in regulation of membrane protease activity